MRRGGKCPPKAVRWSAFAFGLGEWVHPHTHRLSHTRQTGTVATLSPLAWPPRLLKPRHQEERDTAADSRRSRLARHRNWPEVSAFSVCLIAVLCASGAGLRSQAGERRRTAGVSMELSQREDC